MGYACPVCETPQQDAEHLANHMAITGMVRDQAHAGWLDDHVADWRDSSPAEVGAALAENEHVEAVDYDRAAVEHADLPADAERVEESHEHAHGHGHDHGHSHEHTHRGPAAGVGGSHPERAEMEATEGDFDDDVEAIIEEARELTCQQFEDAAVEEESDADSAEVDADSGETATDDGGGDRTEDGDGDRTEDGDGDRTEDGDGDRTDDGDGDGTDDEE